MLAISEVLMSRRDLSSFAELVAYVKSRARGGEIFIEMDVRPPFADTPEDWEARLEAAFSAADNVR